MKTLKNFLLIVLFTLMGGALFAQQGTIDGVVLDKSNQPISGAAIIIKGTQKGTITGLDGKFTLSDVPAQATLTVSCLGYAAQEVPASKGMKVVLADDALGMDEIVVVGYGKMKKSDVTGAMVSVSAKDLVQNPSNNAVEALQGKAAGVYVTSTERPGTVGGITIRGVNSISASNSPLIVIDGVVSRSVGLDMLNPNDIETLEVLKDASATAIYGAMGGNGVILVTTKRGSQGRFSLNYSGTFTFDKVHDVVPMMNASEYIEWRRWGYYYAGLGPRADEPSITTDRSLFTAYGTDETAWGNILNGWGITPEAYAAGSYDPATLTWDGSKVKSTDWTKYTDRTGLTQEHTLSASGGTDRMNAYVSLGYLDQMGTQKGQGYKRYTFRTSVDVTPVKWFSMGGSMNARYSEQQYGIDASGGISGSIPSSIHGKARNIFTYALPYDSDGNRIIYPGGDSTIPTIVDEIGKSEIQNLSAQLAGSFYAQFDLGEMWEPLTGLTFKTNFGPQLSYSHAYRYMSSESVNRISQGTDYVSSNAGKNFSWTLDNIINYDKQINNHTIGVTLLHEAMSNMSTTLYNMSGSGVALGTLQTWWGLNPTTVGTLNSPSYNSLSERALESYMARVNYSFKDKYILTASYRYDGASQLGKGHKWHGFPSLAVGWRLDQEQFMQNQDVFDQLKLRVGWGKTGNYSVGVYSTIETLGSSILPFGSTGSTVYSPSSSLANEAIGWETTDQYNIGVDFSMFGGRLSGVVDLFQNYTNGLIFSVSLPSVSGKTSTKDNVGKTSNHGVDITLNSVNVRNKNFMWSTSLNMAYVKDKIVELQNGKEDMVGSNLFIGQPISVLYGYESAGLWTDSAEDLELMARYNANGHKFAPGMVRPVDQPDENGEIDYKIESNNDRVIIGNTRPLWTGGMTNTFRYKNLEMSVFIYGNFKYVAQTGQYQGGREPVIHMNYYNENNKSGAEYQRPYFNTAGGDSFSGILLQKDASFVKVRQVSFAYYVPEKAVKSLGLSNIKISAQLKNPFSIYQGTSWMDSDVYSVSYNKGYVFGINIGF